VLKSSLREKFVFLGEQVSVGKDRFSFISSMGGVGQADGAG